MHVLTVVYVIGEQLHSVSGGIQPRNGNSRFLKIGCIGEGVMPDKVSIIKIKKTVWSELLWLLAKEKEKPDSG